jgi:hypothetical protein
MATTSNKVPDGRHRLILSNDVWISEKRGMSRARDARTGRLLSEGDGTLRSQTTGLPRRFKK